MIQEWREIQLNELIDIKHGFAFKGEYFTDEPTNDLLLTPGNFSVGGGFQWGKYKFYDGPIPTEYILTEGDLVVSMTDLSKAGDTLGYSAMVPPSEYLLLHNQRIGKVIKKSESIDALYLNYQLRTKTYRNEILASATGSTVRHTSPTKIGAYRFLLPPLDEQKSIASVLGALDEKIENNRRMNETLEEMAQTIFKSWFVDFDPVHAKAAGNAPAHMDAETAALFPSSFGDDGLPVDWIRKTLGEVCIIKSGKRPPTKLTSPNNDNEISVYGGNGIAWYTNEILFDQPFIITGRVGTLGTVYRVYEKCWVSDNALCCFPNSEEAFELVYFAMKEVDYQALNSGSTQPLLTQTALKNQSIIAPPEGLVTVFHQSIKVLFKKILANNEENQTLSELRDTLLPKLMSGEIRVADAESEVEAAV